MKIYCEKCNEELTEYTVKMEEMEQSVMGVKVKYIGKQAYCPTCGNELWEDDTIDYCIDQAQVEYFRQVMKCWDTCKKEHNCIGCRKVKNIKNRRQYEN